jgi:hypothetical protein
MLFGLTAAICFADQFSVTYEDPGEQTVVGPGNDGSFCVGATICTAGEETFDTWNGSKPLTTDFGTGGLITGTYTGDIVKTAQNQYGGAGGTGYFADVSGHNSYTLSLTTNGSVDAPGVNYFGLWFSALDAGNLMQFYDKGVLLYSFTPAKFISLVGACPEGDFCGNPNSNHLGQDANEQFAFLNFYDTTGYFDEIVFTETTTAGFESDNHTVAYMNPAGPNSGTFLQDNAPEPGSVFLMLGGVAILLAGKHGLKRMRKAA